MNLSPHFFEHGWLKRTLVRVSVGLLVEQIIRAFDANPGIPFSVALIKIYFS